MGRRLRMGIVAAMALSMLGFQRELVDDDPHMTVEALHPLGRGPRRTIVRGWDFPEGVLALTWDDGPDRKTPTLARFLHNAHVSGTFFVVESWARGLSDEPGYGPDVECSGHDRLPVLGELVALGHRVGSHTQNHVLLGDAPGSVVAKQIGGSLRALAPFVRNDLRMFRAPGGSWTRESATFLADPELASVVGPVHWDIDAHDWDASLHCRSPMAECEPGPIPGEWRVKPSVIARRYLEQIEHRLRGIVLLHDRVGDVGSSYALDVARQLVPELIARGYVFSAPVLEFAPVRPDKLDAPRGAVLGDVDGDGRSDACVVNDGILACARGGEHGFGPVSTWGAWNLGALHLADIDGDGRADACGSGATGIACATSNGHAFVGRRHFRNETGAFELGDLDADHRIDVCFPGGGCVLSSGARFNGSLPLRFRLADLNGDGRADLCTTDDAGIRCALSDGHAFKASSVWAAESGPFELGDINGDGRADLCVGEDLRCGLAP